MSGLEKITQQILNEAQEKSDQLIETALKEKKEILDQSEEKCDLMRKQSHASLEMELREFSDRSASAREQSRRREVLEEKQRIIADMIEKTYNRLHSEQTGPYFENMKHLFKKYCHSEKGQMVLGSRDLERMPDSFRTSIEETAARKGGSIEISDTPGRITDGFLLIYGNIEENCTFEAIIDANRDILKDCTNRILWEVKDD